MKSETCSGQLIQCLNLTRYFRSPLCDVSLCVLHVKRYNYVKCFRCIASSKQFYMIHFGLSGTVLGKDVHQLCNFFAITDTSLLEEDEVINFIGKV